MVPSEGRAAGVRGGIVAILHDRRHHVKGIMGNTLTVIRIRAITNTALITVKYVRKLEYISVITWPVWGCFRHVIIVRVV